MNGRYLLGGGIGSGKTTAARLFQSLGGYVIEADRHGREVLAPGTSATAAVLERWPQVADADGAIDRVKLAGIVFAAPAELGELEAITWPDIGRRIREEAASVAGVVIVEVPVLRSVVGEEWPLIVVDAPDDIRVDRVLARNPEMTRERILQVMARQPSRGEWLAAAEWVVDNGKTLDVLERDVERVWERIGPSSARP